METSQSEMSDVRPNHPPKPPQYSTKGWSLKNVLAKGKNFRPITTVDITSLQMHEIEGLVQKHESSGIPLLMTGFHRRPSWDGDTFSPEWLSDSMGQSRVMVRNVYDRKDQESSIADYLNYAESASQYAVVDEPERLYAKDAPCPEAWHDWMLANLPSYMLPFGTGDVSTHLGTENRVETLMTYIGIGDTYTPAHKDSCASVGQNLMVHTAENASSFWFLTSTEDSYKASMYWRILGQELDHESHVATVEELAKAKFPIYVCEQQLGGFVIVPPQSCHQVINSGGLTMKLSWSRMTAKSFARSIDYELPIYQRVCRPEIYRVRATIASVVAFCSQKLSEARRKDLRCDPAYISLLKDFLPLYRRMLVESFDPHWKSYPIRSFDGESCDCCGADIWQSAMVCNKCLPLPEEGGARPELIICSSCYVDGRSCYCSIMQPSQDHPFDKLLEVANTATTLVRSYLETDQGQEFTEMRETDLTSTQYPPFFRVATFLHQFRLSNATERPRLCNVYRSGYRPSRAPHNTYIDDGIACKECHSRACWYHIAEKYNVHIMTAIGLSKGYKAWQKGRTPSLKVDSLYSDRWHEFHKSGVSTTGSEISFGQAWEVWLPQLVLLFRSTRPLSESVLLGWYDGTRLDAHSAGTLPEDAMDAETISTSQPYFQSVSIPPLAYSTLKRKASSNGTAKGPPRKKPRQSRKQAHESDSSTDVISMSYHGEGTYGSSTDEISTPFRHRPHRKPPTNNNHNALPFPPSTPTSEAVRTPSRSKNLPATSKFILQNARSESSPRKTPRKTGLERQVNQLKMQVERLTAENEAERARAAAREQETRAEMAKLWKAITKIRVKDEGH